MGGSACKLSELKMEHCPIHLKCPPPPTPRSVNHVTNRWTSLWLHASANNRLRQCSLCRFQSLNDARVMVIQLRLGFVNCRMGALTWLHGDKSQTRNFKRKLCRSREMRSLLTHLHPVCACVCVSVCVSEMSGKQGLQVFWEKAIFVWFLRLLSLSGFCLWNTVKTFDGGSLPASWKERKDVKERREGDMKANRSRKRECINGWMFAVFRC